MSFEKGKNNPNWKGGTSKYPNHCLLKKRRLVVLEKAKGKCKICNKKANVVHHKDGSVDNHELSNLIPICNPCHKILHIDDDGIKKQATSKYIRLYGMTLGEMANDFGGSLQYYRILHQKDILTEFLEKKKQSKIKIANT